MILTYILFTKWINIDYDSTRRPFLIVYGGCYPDFDYHCGHACWLPV